MSRIPITGTRPFDYVLRFDYVLAIVPFVLLAIALYWPVFEGRVPLPTDITLEEPVYRTTAFFPDPGPHAEMSDLTARIYPWRLFATERLASGRLPEWNPWTMGGAPFAANPESAVFYPPHFLYSLVDVPTAWSLMFLLHLVLAGTFTTLFLREIECDTLAAIGGGVVFALSGFMTAWRGFPLGATATWLPLVAFSVARLRRRQAGGPIVLAAFAFAMPVLAGNPQAALAVTVVGLALAVFEAFRARTGPSSLDRTRFTAFLAFAFLLALLLAAVQWLPAVEWNSLTVGNLDIAWPARPLAGAIAWLSRDLSANPNADGVAIPDSAVYVGVLAWVLAPIAIVGVRGLRGYGIFFAVLGFSAAIGEPIVGAVAGFGNFEDAPRLLVAVFSLAALSGIGLATVARAPETGTKLWLVAPLLASPVAGAVYGLASVNEGDRDLIAGLAVVSVVLILVRSVRLVRPAAFLGVALVILVLDLGTSSYGAMPFVTRDTIFPESPTMAFLEEGTGPGERTMFLDDVGDSDLGLVEGVEMLSGRDGLLSGVRAFLSGYADPGHDGLEFSSDAIVARAARDRRLDMMNVRYLVAPAAAAVRMIDSAPDRFGAVFVDGPVAVLENGKVLPPAYLVPALGMEFIGEWPDRLERVRDPAFDPETQVVLRSPPGLATSLSAETPTVPTVDIVEYTGDRIRLDVHTPLASILVIGQAFYPGWRATVNGREQNMIEVNAVLAGIGLDSGSHVVELEFESHAVRTGAAMALAGVLFIVTLIVGGRRIPVFRSSVNGWEGENSATLALLAGSLVAVALIGLLASGYHRPAPAPTIPEGIVANIVMDIVEPDGPAGEGSFAIRFEGLSDVHVPIRYTVDDGRVEVLDVYLDPDPDVEGWGTTRIDVPANAPRGEYRFLEARLPGTGRWTEVEGSFTVR